MAGRKKEIQIQTPIHNEMEWDEMFEAKGLSVVDVHQGWCGPCKAILSMFRRLKMEFGDELLHFHTVEASLIPLLKGFEGKCEPAFLFIVAGKIADYVKGVNAPVINKIIVAFLEGEVEFYEKGVERQEVKTIQLYDVEDEVEEFMQAAISKQVEILFTILVIKPNAIITGNDNIIKEQISEAGFQIMAEEMAHLTEEEAKELYEHKKHQRNYEEIVQTMSSGVCDVLLLSEEGEIKDFEHEFDVQEAEIAKTNDEDSDISELAYRLFSFFFPTVYEKFKKTEKTLAIIRPQLLELQKGIKDAKAKGIIKSSEGELQDSCFNTFMTNILIHDEILEEITNARFTIGRQKEINLSEHQVTKFYTLNEKSDLLPEFIEYMISGPILVLALSRDNAIQHWRNLLGPHDLETAKQEYPLSLRARFAFEDVPFNQLHGSHDAEMAKKELQYFFPFEHTLVAIKPVAIREYKDAIIVRIREAKFTISAIKPVEMSQETAAEFYKDYEEEQFFNQLIENMSQGPTVMMILTKENAVRDWRELMGPADPELAKTSFPNSLRAQFDTSILQNGLHGSSTVKHAKQYIQLFFGDTLLESFGVHLDEELSISTTDLQTKSPSAEPSTTAIEPSDLVDVDAPIDQQEVTTSEAMLAPESQDVSAPTEAPDAGTGEIRAPGEAPDNRQEEISAPTEAPDAGTEEISATGEATDAGPEEISAPTEAPDAGTEEISATGEATDAGPEEISAPTEAPDAGTEDIPTPGEAPDADREEIPASGEAPDVGTQDVSAPGETPNASTKDVTSPGEAPDAGTGEISAPDEAPAVGTEEISAPVEAPEAGTEGISAPVEAPEAGAEEISAPGEAPEAGTEEISAPVEAPEAGTEEISAPGEAPEAGTEEISAPVEAPEAGTEEISAPGEAPEAGTEEISAPGEAPEAGTEEISAPGEAPEAGTEEISAPGEAPEAGTEEISAPGEAPEAGTEEISAPGEAPEAGTEEISAPGEAPDAGTKDVSAPPEVPETDIADVSASSKSSDTSSQDVPPPAEEPDAGTEEVSAPSEVPDAGTQDVSAPTEAPDAGNEDVSARTETPDAGNEHVSARTEAPDVSTEHVSARTEAPDVSTDHVSAPTETTDAGNEAVSAPGEDPAAGTKDVSAPTEAP